MPGVVTFGNDQRLRPVFEKLVSTGIPRETPAFFFEPRLKSDLLVIGMQR
jgi:hypothetical protein